MATEYATGKLVLVDGAELEPDVAAQIEEVIVDESVDLPAMFAITLGDPKQDVIGRGGFGTGAAVQLSVTGRGENKQERKPLADGEVVSVECEYDETGPRVVVRGYALSHRLHRGRKSRTFVNVTDSDIVTQIAREAELETGEIEATSEVHEHVAQANVTDWEFLRERAASIGFELDMVEGRLGFHAPSTSADAPPASELEADAESRSPRHLTYLHNLFAFHGRISAAEQVGDVEVRSWDDTQKLPMVATLPTGTEAAVLDLADPASMANSFGNPTQVAVMDPWRSESQVEAAARALVERIASSFVEADGTAAGHAELRAGAAVRISRVSEEFSGAYVLSHVRHVIDDSGYRTHFRISGRQDRSLLGVVSHGGKGANGRVGGVQARQGWGLVRGLVSDNDDPKSEGRVKVKFPWLAEKFSTNWAPVLQLGAGANRGSLFLPAVDDEVLVGFTHGDFNLPVVIGGVFNSIDKPPTYGSYLDHGTVTSGGIYSRNGHAISLHDAKDASGIILKVVDGDRQNVVSIGLNGLDEKLVVHSSGAVEVRADGDISLEGKNITIKADKELVLVGKPIKLN